VPSCPTVTGASQELAFLPQICGSVTVVSIVTVLSPSLLMWGVEGLYKTSA